MTSHNDQERALFEAAFPHLPHKRYVDGTDQYFSDFEQGAWLAWQARAQLATAGKPAPDGLLLAKETVVELPDGSKELGYTPMPNLGIFSSSEEVFDVIRELQLPLGWVAVRFGQVISVAAAHRQPRKQ